MSSESRPENGTATSSVASQDASQGKRSKSEDAQRKRDERAGRKAASGSTFGGRGGGEPSTKGNPIAPGPRAAMGEPISATEAKEQLLYAHIGIAKVIRSAVDFDELDEEFTVAGKNYAHVANHMYPPLRVVIRFVAPVVLVAVLLVIWGHMIAATPWVHQIRDWWQSRHADEVPPSERPHVVPDSANGATVTGPDGWPVVTPAPAAPTPRPRISRSLGNRF